MLNLPPFWVVAALGLLYYVYKTWYLFPMKIVRGVNSDYFTATVFIALVNEARGTMLVCDDGNSMPGSIYESKRVVAAVQAKLKSDPEFRMLCMFSSQENTLFKREFKAVDQIKIEIVDPRRTTHFKIINNGRKGYVSTHAEGETERNYTIYSGMYGPGRRRVFGRHMDDIKRVFPDAA